MNLISSTLSNYGTNTGSTFKYWGADDQLQTAAPTIKKFGSAVMFGLALSATTMDVPNYIRPQGAQRSTFYRTHNFGLSSFVNNNAAGIYAEQMDVLPLSKSILESLIAAGVNTSRAASIITTAQSSLSAMGYPVLKIEAKNMNDPEEDATYVTINLIVSASFEKTLELDSELARIIIKNFANIPSAFSIAVKEVA